MKRRVLSIVVALAISAPLMGANYLIVSSEALRPGYEELKKFRESPEGGSYTVSVMTVESLGLSPTIGLPLDMVSDPYSDWHEITPDNYKEINIRARVIREAISSFWKTRKSEENYVVLLGRSDMIPPVQVIFTDIPPGSVPQVPYTPTTGISSDLYYACLQYPWEPEQNHRFFPRNPIPVEQVTPDLMLGRLPFDDSRKVVQYVDRIRRYMVKGSGLVPNSILIHGTQHGRFTGDPFPQEVSGTDGYPWLNDEVNHPRARAHLANGHRVLDSELWLRNTFLEKIYPYRTPEKQWRLDIFFDYAAGDPVTRDRFTDRYSVNNPRDIDVYLHESPELVLVSAHGLAEGAAKISTSAVSTPGNRLGFLYSTACNTATIDSYAIRGGIKMNEHGWPPLGVHKGKWGPFVMGEYALTGGDDTHGALAYIAMSREGYSLKQAHSVGDYSPKMLAFFAEEWAKGDDKTIGQMFNAHRLPFMERLTSEMSVWRCLMTGTLLLGDPALRPMRATPAFYQQPFPVRLEGVDGQTGVREVMCRAGLSIGEQVEEPAAPGKVFEGWLEAGESHDATRPLRYYADGVTLVARWRDAYPEELDPTLYAQQPPSFERKIYVNFDSEPANTNYPALSGAARMLRNKNAVIQKFTERDAGSPMILTLWTYHRPSADLFDQQDKVVAELTLPGNSRLSLRRQGDQGYTWFLNDQPAAAAIIGSDYWVNHTVLLNPVPDGNGGWKGTLSFYHNATPYDQVVDLPRISLPKGRATLFLGGDSAGKPFNYGQQNVQWLDEVALFQGRDPQRPGGVEMVKELASRPVPKLSAAVVLNGKTPTRLPASSVLEENQNHGLLIKGSGTLQLTGGQTLPSLEIADSTEINTLPPPNGFTTMTEETKKLLGFGGLIWTGAPVPVPGWAQVGAVAMKITDLTLDDPQGMRVKLQLTSPETEVRFDPSVPAGNFSALPVVLEKDEGVPPAETPAAVQVDGGRATLTLPKGENPKTKLFRILYSSRRR